MRDQALSNLSFPCWCRDLKVLSMGCTCSLCALFLKGVSIQLEFQQSQRVRQNPTGSLPALSLPSGWPHCRRVGAVEAEEIVTWNNPQVADITKRFVPPPSYSIPACVQSCKRLSQVNSSLFWLSLFHGRALNRTYMASIYNKKKKISADSI